LLLSQRKLLRMVRLASRMPHSVMAEPQQVQQWQQQVPRVQDVQQRTQQQGAEQQGAQQQEVQQHSAQRHSAQRRSVQRHSARRRSAQWRSAQRQQSIMHLAQKASATASGRALLLPPSAPLQHQLMAQAPL
jgi:hypothetical protein